MSSIRFLGYESKVRFVVTVDVPVLAFDVNDALDKANDAIDEMLEETDVKEVKRISEWVEMSADKGQDVTEDE